MRRWATFDAWLPDACVALVRRRGRDLPVKVDVCVELRAHVPVSLRCRPRGVFNPLAAAIGLAGGLVMKPFDGVPELYVETLEHEACAPLLQSKDFREAVAALHRSSITDIQVKQGSPGRIRALSRCISHADDLDDLDRARIRETANQLAAIERAIGACVRDDPTTRPLVRRRRLRSMAASCWAWGGAAALAAVAVSTSDLAAGGMHRVQDIHVAILAGIALALCGLDLSVGWLLARGLPDGHRTLAKAAVPHLVLMSWAVVAVALWANVRFDASKPTWVRYAVRSASVVVRPEEWWERRVRAGRTYGRPPYRTETTIDLVPQVDDMGGGAPNFATPPVHEHEIRDLMSSGHNVLAVAMRDGALGIPWEMQRDFQRDASLPRPQLVIFSAKDPRAPRVGSVSEDFKPVFQSGVAPGP